MYPKKIKPLSSRGALVASTKKRTLFYCGFPTHALRYFVVVIPWCVYQAKITIFGVKPVP